MIFAVVTLFFLRSDMFSHVKSKFSTSRGLWKIFFWGGGSQKISKFSNLYQFFAYNLMSGGLIFGWKSGTVCAWLPTSSSSVRAIRNPLFQRGNSILMKNEDGDTGHPRRCQTMPAAWGGGWLGDGSLWTKFWNTIWPGMALYLKSGKPMDKPTKIYQSGHFDGLGRRGGAFQN